MNSIDTFKESFKLSQFPVQKSTSDVRSKENAMWPLMSHLSKHGFGYDIGINHNPEHVYAPFPSVIVYNVDTITKDWVHAVQINDNGELVVTKLTPNYTQKSFIASVIEDHEQDEADSNRW
jgi:hypothetical protein